MQPRTKPRRIIGIEAHHLYLILQPVMDQTRIGTRKYAAYPEGCDDAWAFEQLKLALALAGEKLRDGLTADNIASWRHANLGVEPTPLKFAKARIKMAREGALAEMLALAAEEPFVEAAPETPEPPADDRDLGVRLLEIVTRNGEKLDRLLALFHPDLDH